jgi:hypothetical protein
MTDIGDCAFRDCSGLTELTISPGVTRIGAYAFDGCSGLTRLALPSSVTSIASGAFARCSDLTEVIISSGVSSIGDRAFGGCKGLVQLTIPGDVAQIGYEILREATRIKRVTLIGCTINQTVVETVAPVFAPHAKVVSPVLAGQQFGRYAIIAVA